MARFDHKYESIEEMIQAADHAYQARRRASTIQGLRANSRFIGRSFTSWEDVKAKANESWPEGLEEFQSMLFELSHLKLPEVTSVRRRPRWDPDQGDEVDKDRLNAGQDYWRTTRRESLTCPSMITIVTDISTSCHRDSETILWRGALATVLTDLLEKAGHRVELWAMNNVSNAYPGGYDASILVCLKRAEQPLDTCTVVNAVSGWFFRTIFFQAYYDCDREPHPGLGHPEPIDPTEERIQALVGNRQLVIVDKVWSREAALAKAQEVIDSMSDQ